MDRFGQWWRIAKISPYIDNGARVLDIGCGDGALFERLGTRIREGVGIDPNARPRMAERFRLISGRFPADLAESDSFDAIVALAVLEHIPLAAQDEFAHACFERLRPGGVVILTVPSPMVDRIVHLEMALGLADGCGAMHEHYGFEPSHTTPLFKRAGFALERERSFQLRLNHLFVFRRGIEATNRKVTTEGRADTGVLVGREANT